MEIIYGHGFLISVFLLNVCLMSTGERLFSIFTHVLPTHNVDEVIFYSHLSWEQQNVTTCVTHSCLKVYRLTNKTARFFGRMTDYQWSCTKGCVTNDVISDLSKLMFTEVSGYHGNKWEAGEELMTYKFKPGTTDIVQLSLQHKGGGVPSLIETIEINIGVRNDTNRTNVSPSVAVLPIYQVPLECSLEVDLSPYDGDGDFTQCTWTQKLPSASLNQKLCKVTVQTSTGGGYVVGQYYHGTVTIGDYSNSTVSVSRHGATSVTHGPFSKLPVKFTVIISPALHDKTDCQPVPKFEPPILQSVGSYLYPANYSSSFTSKENNATILTVGHSSTLFNRIVNVTSTTETAEWVLGVNESGIYRSCAMLYNHIGLPGETSCDTLLIGDDDECANNNTCTDQPGGHCTDYWHYHTCTYDKIHASTRIPHALEYDEQTTSELNLGLIAGAAGGGVLLIAAMITGIILYLRYISKKKQKIKDENEQSKDTYNKQ